MTIGKKIMIVGLLSLLVVWMAVAALFYVVIIGDEGYTSPADFEGSLWQCRLGEETLMLRVDEKRTSRCYAVSGDDSRLLLFSFDSLGGTVTIYDIQKTQWSSDWPKKGRLRLDGHYLASPYEFTVSGPDESLDGEFWQGDRSMELVFERVDRVKEGQSHWAHCAVASITAALTSFVMAIIQLVLAGEFFQNGLLKRGERRLLIASVIYPFFAHLAAWILCMNVVAGRDALVWLLGFGMNIAVCVICYPVVFLSLYVLIRNGIRD